MDCGMEAVAIVAAKRQPFVSEAQIKQAEALLTAMAKKPKLLTLQQTLEQLRPKILALMVQGYTHQDLVEALKTLGIPVALSTLRQSLREQPEKRQKAALSTETKAKQQARLQAVAKPEIVESVEIDVDAVIAAIGAEAKEELDEFALQH